MNWNELKRRTRISWSRSGSTALLCVFLLPHILCAHGNLHKEIEILSARIEVSPRNVELWLERADLSRQHRDYDGALRDLVSARELDPKAAGYDFLLGRLMVQARWYKSALFHLNRFIENNPSDVDALLLRAKSLYVTFEIFGACRDYDAAIPMLKSPQPGHFLEQAQAHALHSKTGPKVAIRHLEEGMRRIGAVPTLQEAALQYELRLRDFTGALARVDQLLSQAPRKERWLIQKGQILLRAERVAEARVVFNDVVALVDALPEVVRNRPINQDLKQTAEAFLLEIEVPNN
jgi:tetratricopeptide (TPR) repeat protein